MPIRDAVGVVVLRPQQFGHAKARAKLDALHGGDAIGDSRDAVLEAIEHWVADAGGHAIGHALDDAAHRVELGLGRQDLLVHGEGCLGAHAGKLVRANRGELRGVKGHVVQRLVADALRPQLGDVRHDVDAQRVLERLKGDASRNAQRSGEAPGEVAAARHVVMVAVAKVCGVVGVPRARDAAQALIVLATRVRVLDDGRERRAAGVAVHETGEDSGAVGLATGG